MILFLAQLVTSQKLPIQRFEYSANLNGYFLDITPLHQKMEDEKKPYVNYTYDNWIYYVVPGDDLDDNIQYIPDFHPEWFGHYTNETLDYVSVARCNPDKKVCQPCITLNDWDWAYLDPLHPTAGFIYSADGQPINANPQEIGGDQITVDVDFVFFYDSKAPSTLPDYRIDIDETDLPNIHITFEATTSLVPQPKAVSPPPPTPSPFEPICRFYHRNSEDRGFDFNLDTLNTGPYGNRLKYTTSNNQNYTLFYQPCELSSCPPRYTCEGTYSSVWLCSDEDSGQTKACIDGGSVVDGALNIVLDESVTPPFAVQSFYDHVHSSTLETSTIVHMYCDSDLPKGHVVLDSFDYSNDLLTLETRSEEICEEPLPKPVPPPPGSDLCDYSITSLDGKYLVSINLAAYNNDNYWHVEDLNVVGMTGYTNAELWYQPCGAISCPAGTYCEGKDDATIWICFSPKSSSTRTCRSFGDYNNATDISINVEDYTDRTFSSGLEVDYYSSKKHGKVYIACNNLLSPGQFSMGNIATFVDPNTVYFNISAEDACAVGPPTWHPPTPDAPKKPTPTPQPSPNPIDFACNDTHYIYTDLDQITQDVYRNSVKLAYPGSKPSTISRWDVVYHPWDQSPCPNGAYCFDMPPANIWGCWNEDSGRYVCFPIGDVDYGNELRAMTLDNLDLGVEIDYDGAWGFKTEINVKCKRGEEKRQILFDGETTSAYTFNNGNKVIFETDSEYVCPLAFEKAGYLPRTPSPTPTPDKFKGPTYYETNLVNNAFASLDISKLKEIDSLQVYVGYRAHLSKHIMRYSPIKKVSCPSGYNCLGQALSNLWFCSDYTTRSTLKEAPVCIPAGDIDSGLVVGYNLSNPMAGINFNYDGGYGNFTETHMVFQCNASVPAHTIQVEPVVQRMPPVGGNTVFVVRAHTPDVCPIVLAHGKVTIGTVFMMVIEIAAIAYFSGLLLFKMIFKGVVELPNEEFWNEVLESVVAIFLFAFSCGRKTSTGKDSYDSI